MKLDPITKCLCPYRDYPIDVSKTPKDLWKYIISFTDEPNQFKCLSLTKSMNCLIINNFKEKKIKFGVRVVEYKSFYEGAALSRTWYDAEVWSHFSKKKYLIRDALVIPFREALEISHDICPYERAVVLNRTVRTIPYLSQIVTFSYYCPKKIFTLSNILSSRYVRVIQNNMLGLKDVFKAPRKFRVVYNELPAQTVFSTAENYFNRIFSFYLNFGLGG